MKEQSKSPIRSRRCYPLLALYLPLHSITIASLSATPLKEIDY